MLVILDESKMPRTSGFVVLLIMSNRSKEMESLFLSKNPLVSYLTYLITLQLVITIILIIIIPVQHNDVFQRWSSLIWELHNKNAFRNFCVTSVIETYHLLVETYTLHPTRQIFQ